MARAFSVTLSAKGRAGKVRPISPKGGYAYNPDVATNASGEFAVAWDRQTKIEVVRLKESGAATKLVRIPAQGYPSAPILLVARNGSPVPIWSHCCVPGKTNILATRISRSGRAERPTAVYDGDGLTEDPVAIATEAGKPVVGWSTYPGGANVRFAAR